MTKISEITAGSSVIATDLFEKETSGGTSQKVTGEMIKSFIVGETPTISIAVQLSSAQLKTLSSVNISAVSAPGAGKSIAVSSCIFQYKANDAQLAPGEIGVLVSGSAQPMWNAIPTYAEDSTTHLVANSAFNALIENQPLLIYASADSVDGDGAGVLLIDYKIVTLPV